MDGSGSSCCLATLQETIVSDEDSNPHPVCSLGAIALMNLPVCSLF